MTASLATSLEKTPQELDEEVVKVQKKTIDLVVKFQDKLDEARERTPCTSAGVVETEQRRMPCLDKLIAEKPLAEKPQLAIPRKKT